MAFVLIIFIVFNVSIFLAEICIKSVFLHSPEPLKPTSKLFCVVRQNANACSATIQPFVTTTHFYKYLPIRRDIAPAQAEVVKVWNDKKTTPFEYPAAVYSEYCSGTAPLPQFMNVTTICHPIWPSFDEKSCTELKYLNVSYYLHKYFMEKDGNWTILSVEGTPETSHLVRWLSWNGTACINAVSKVTLTFFTRAGLLENISANIEYADITTLNYVQQQYQFHARFIENLPIMSGGGIQKSLGYEIGQALMIGGIIGAFTIPFGMDCNDKNAQMVVRFGIQISSACRIRVSTCNQMVAHIRDILSQWATLEVNVSPDSVNETFSVESYKLPSQKKTINERCELTTAAVIQFAFARFGNIQSYSQRMLSCRIKLSKADIVDLTKYPYQYIYLSFFVHFVDETAAPVLIFSQAPSIDIVLPPDFFYPFFTKD